ncbi:hypothetical protein Prudu_012847 [Prunus dulcis]|uniref:Uncharacterized protein n=1 Tax=Prunus dulcis TaxID=3755 RepID=A0A4Y1REC8_PRUDU|nr:hypothetical protein Prudu_012847 [Prunus dulcis]
MARRAIGEQLIILNENLYIQHASVNVVLPSIEPNAGGKSKCSKTATKIGGVGFESRKALNDITNKILPKEASSKKKTLPKEDFNVAEEVVSEILNGGIKFEIGKLADEMSSVYDNCHVKMHAELRPDERRNFDTVNGKINMKIRELVAQNHIPYWISLNMQREILTIIFSKHLIYYDGFKLREYYRGSCRRNRAAQGDDLDSPPCYPEIEEIPEPEELSFFQWLSPPSSPLRWESPPFSPLALPLEVVEFVLREGND